MSWPSYKAGSQSAVATDLLATGLLALTAGCRSGRRLGLVIRHSWPVTGHSEPEKGVNVQTRRFDAAQARAFDSPAGLSAGYAQEF